MEKRLVTLIGLAIAAGLVVAACTNSSTDNEVPTTIAGTEVSEPVEINLASTDHDEAATLAAEESHAEHEGHNAIGHEHETVEESDHETETHNGHEAAVIPEAHEMTLTATDWEFAPETLTVRLAEPVTIVLVNHGIVEHDVEIADFGLHLHTPPGGTLKGSFVPDKIGTFEFACEIPGHRALGMVGKLVVTR